MRTVQQPNVGGPLAGFVSRWLAHLIDQALVVALVAVEALLWRTLLTARPIDWFFQLLGQFGPATANGLRWVLEVGIPVSLAVLIPLGYYVFFFTLTGQTIGKRFVGLRVVTARGGRLTGRQALLRTLGYMLSTLPLYAGFLAMLFDSQRRTWHDRLAGTRVVYAWEARPSDLPLLRRMLRPVAAVSAPGVADEVAARGQHQQRGAQ